VALRDSLGSAAWRAWRGQGLVAIAASSGIAATIKITPACPLRARQEEHLRVVTVTQRQTIKIPAGYRAIIRHAQEVTGNVALTCRYYGISRTVFYRWLGPLSG
jgi:hypothetical protein